MPLHLRFLAWVGMMLICFVVGYHGTSFLLKYLDRRWPGQELPGRPDQAAAAAERPSGVNVDSRLDMQKITLSLFYPKDEVLMEEKADVIVQTREDNIEDAVLRLLELSGLLDDSIEVRHVFRNADTVYLNFSGGFPPALSKAGAKFSTLFITGIVRTMRANFSPISKVRFLVDSKVESGGAPVDLTATWQLPK